MPRAPKACGSYRCPELVTGRTYCEQHEAQRQQEMAERRGTTAQRGYGSPHQRQRKHWAPLVATGTVACRRCHQPIKPNDAWDLGHDDHDRTLPASPEHAGPCNRSAAGLQSPTGRTPSTPSWA